MHNHTHSDRGGGVASHGGSDLGRRVSARRAELGLSVEEVARRAGSAPGYITYMEDQQAVPGVGFLLRLADALETTVPELAGGGMDLPPGLGEASPRAELVVLKPHECRALLSTHGVGRVAVSTHRGPAVIPVNYVVIGGGIAYRTAPRTAAAAAAGQKVAFEVDHFDEALSRGWSVNVVGMAHAVTGDAAARGFDEQAFTEPWAGGERHLWFEIFPDYITGRRIDVAPQGDRQP
ncbi:helix-turn-helix domain-containing protein [Streptomyces hebeiensis]